LQTQSRQFDYKLGEFEEYVQRLVEQLPSLSARQAQSETQPRSSSSDSQQPDLTDQQQQQQQRRMPVPKVRRLGAELMTTDPCVPDAPDFAFACSAGCGCGCVGVACTDDGDTAAGGC